MRCWKRKTTTSQLLSSETPCKSTAAAVDAGKKGDPLLEAQHHFDGSFAIVVCRGSIDTCH